MLWPSRCSPSSPLRLVPGLPVWFSCLFGVVGCRPSESAPSRRRPGRASSLSWTVALPVIAVGSAAGGGKKDRRMTLRSCAGESAHSSDDGRNMKASRMLCTSSTTCSPHDFAS